MPSAQLSPLSGITVVESTNYVAAPSAAAILADMGADVIRVEPPQGDPWRGQQRPARVDDPAAAAFDYQFTVDNRGKRSIAVNLEDPQGQSVVHRLVAGAHIFICNLLPERQQRFGLDPATLAGHNPGLVHATLTGYGTTGPEAWRPGFDVTAFFGRSGLLDASREGPDGDVPQVRPAQGDHTTGLALSTAVLAALRLAEQTGEMQIVETSLYEAAVWTQASDYSVSVIEERPLRPRARHQQIIATSNRFPCGDGKWLVVTMPNESAWPLWCRTIGRPEWLEDDRFVDLRGRFRNMEALVAGIDEALSVRGRDEWGEIFDEAGVIWGPVLGIHEVVADPQARAIGLFPEIDGTAVGAIRTVRAPMRFANAKVAPRGPAPSVGEHTDELLASVGYSDAEIAELRGSGAVD